MTVQTMARVSVDTLAIGVLERAADRIKRDGFAQAQFFDGVTGRYCALGAISVEAHLVAPDWRDCIRVMNAALGAVSVWLGTFIVGWNDVRGRTPDEVIGALLGGAAELRAVA
jgi:hypothetical protein